MVGDERGDQQQLDLQPQFTQWPMIRKQQLKPEQCRQYATNGHDRVQLALHNQKPLMAAIVVAVSVINEEPGEIKQTGKPGHHKNDMKGFYPEHNQRTAIVGDKVPAWASISRIRVRNLLISSSPIF